MTNKQANISMLIVIGAFLIFRLVKPPALDDAVGNILVNLSIELIGGILLYFILSILQNIKRISLYLMVKTFYYNKEIRLSIAYLYRIKVNDKYLLVKSRTRGYYQPVGGAYKTLPDSKKTFEELKVRPDKLIETSHGIAKGDLRVFVPGHNVIEFIDWFHSKKDREISPWREFCEELITTGILPWKEFRYIDYEFKGIIQTPIIKLDSGYPGIFIFEIYDLIPNDVQIPILEDLYQKGNTDYFIWANDSMIERLGHNENTKEYEYNISPHTKYAHNLKYKK